MFKYYGQSDGTFSQAAFLKGGKYMIDHIPYIHLIEVYNEKYFYDVNTNGIIHISDEMYDFFEKLLSKTSITRKQIGKEYSALSEECKSDIDLLMQKGFLCDKNENIIFRHPETDRIEEFYKTNLNYDDFASNTKL